MVLAMRRSEQAIDMRIFLLAGGVALTTVADVIFSLQTAAGTYVEWAPLDGLWLFSYGLIALAAWFVTRPTVPQAATYRSMKGWRLAAPYSAVALLFGVRLITSSGNDLVLNITTTLVAGLLVLRQNVAIRERGELLERQRDDLVASVSHELRTPLTGIQGYAQLLSESWDILSADDRREMLETISTQSNHLGHIVSDLIDVARDRLQNVKLKRIEARAVRPDPGRRGGRRRRKEDRHRGRSRCQGLGGSGPGPPGPRQPHHQRNSLRAIRDQDCGQTSERRSVVRGSRQRQQECHPSFKAESGTGSSAVPTRTTPACPAPASVCRWPETW